MPDPAFNDQEERLGLEELLGAWTRAQRLSDAQAEVVRHAIVEQAQGLDPTWWRDFSTRISDVVVRATATPVPVLPTRALLVR